MRQRLLTACRPSSTDAVLAGRAAAGDDDAFETLYVRYQPRLEAYCRSIVRHDEDARDAVQNAMTNALVALRRDHPANVQGWLFRIAHNEAISLLRRRRPTSELADVVYDTRLGPAGDLLMREELRATLDNVRALPHNLQHPLLLRELAGLSYGQVAEVIGGTPAAARKAVFDARTALSADRAGRDEACSVIRQSLSEGDGRRRRARVVRSHLQSCQSCCAWESEQRQRRYHLASLLPAASAAGTASGWLAGLFGGGTTAVAGISGSLATNAKVAASLAVIAAGAAPVVERVGHDGPAKVGASAATAQVARRAVASTRATAAASIASARSAASAGATTASAPSAARAGATTASARGRVPAARATGSRAAKRAASNETSAGRDSSASPRGEGDTSTAKRGTGDAATGSRTKAPANRTARGARAPATGYETSGRPLSGARPPATGDEPADRPPRTATLAASPGPAGDGAATPAGSASRAGSALHAGSARPSGDGAATPAGSASRAGSARPSGAGSAGTVGTSGGRRRTNAAPPGTTTSTAAWRPSGAGGQPAGAADAG